MSLIESWFPQPAVIPEVDLFIHHGGNNSFNEALYFGKPAIIMPYCWDGLDNAARITDTGYGADLPRYKWTDATPSTIERLLDDTEMRRRLDDLGRYMRSADGRHKAARLLVDVRRRDGGHEQRAAFQGCCVPCRPRRLGSGPGSIARALDDVGCGLDRNPDGSSECGIWVCTPGEWRCESLATSFAIFSPGAAPTHMMRAK